MAAAWKSDVLEVIQENQTANGLALILTNSYDTCHRLDTLTGTRSDGDSMKKSFQTLNFSTCHHHNLPKEATLQLLYSVANYHQFPPSYRRIAFIFSGHGAADHKLYTGEGETINVKDILTAFFPERAPRSGNIAKLFFIDACRGKQSNSGVIVSRSGREIQTLTVPKHGNFLVAYSTIPDHLSYEERAKGGIWITSLADKLCHRNASVHDILSEVNSELISKYQKDCYANFVQQPEFISRLNEKVNLFAEAKSASMGVAQESDSDDDLEMGYVVIDPKSDFTRSLPLPLISSPRTMSVSKTAGVQNMLRKVLRINPNKGRRSQSFHESQPPERSQSVSREVNRSFSTGPYNGLRSSSEVHVHAHLSPSLPQLKREESSKEKLERYCVERGKPKPHFSTEKVDKKYRATVYVAKTCGRVSGEMMKSKWEAEMNAAQQLLQKLEL